jgi:hypothetical protein
MDPGVLGPIARYRSSDNLIVIEIGDVLSEWFLLPLETVLDQRRVLSMQLTFAYLNEVREVDFEIVNAIAGRVGRYPRQIDGGVTQPCVLMDSNPPSDGTPLHEFLTVRHPDNLRYIHQPGGLDPKADWLRYLPGGRTYYDNLIIGQSKDWVDVHVHSRFGRDVSGQAVFGQTFDEEWHVSGRIAPLPGRSLVVGLDPGLNPAAVIMQPTPNGGVSVLRETYAENMLFRTFLTQKVLPLLNEPDLMHRPFMVVMDPAGRNRTGVSDDTPLGICRQAQVPVRLAPTNDVRARILGVERWLTTTLAGRQPAFRIDGKRCPVLAEALARGYRYRRRRTGELEATPEKRHPTSDVADALQYGCLGLSGRIEPRVRDLTRQEGANALAWT